MHDPARFRQNLLRFLLVAAVIPYFVNLGVSSIWDANEAFYAQTPREMLEAGDWVTPSFNFQLRMNKPVLSYWEVAASYKLFGVVYSGTALMFVYQGPTPPPTMLLR